jgi:two-component SAPR family response regulator
MRVILVDENQEALDDMVRQIRQTQLRADIYTFPTQAALDRWLEENRPVPLRVQTFGNFEVFWGAQPIHFERSKTRELFAYLIDRRGAGSTMGELISVLWEGRPDTPGLRSQLRSLITDLRSTLRDLGAEVVIIKGRDYIAVDPARVDCDYYRYLAGEKAVRSAFRGEYMSNYSWAEITVGSLHQKK